MLLNRTEPGSASVQQSQTLNVEVYNGEMKAVLFAEHPAKRTGSCGLKPKLPDGF